MKAIILLTLTLSSTASALIGYPITGQCLHSRLRSSSPVLVSSPYMTSILDKAKPHLVWPPLVGTYHVHALPFMLGNAPTIGPTWYIVLFVILNIAFTAGGYKSFPYPSNAWFPNAWQETMACMSACTGVLAFALAPGVGKRLDVGTLLEREESEEWHRIGVVVCEPGGLCDEVRSVVSERTRASAKARWELDVEALSW